jgi:hypothetical protein
LVGAHVTWWAEYENSEEKAERKCKKKMRGEFKLKV